MVRMLMLRNQSGLRSTGSWNVDSALEVPAGGFYALGRFVSPPVIRYLFHIDHRGRSLDHWLRL